MSFDLLNRALTELETALTECDIKLIVGGGFGLFLLQTDLTIKEDIRTLIARKAWCIPRSTADIDVIIETCIVASLDHIKSLRESLDHLGYTVIAGVEYMHFEKLFSEKDRVEINFLTGPIENVSLVEKIKVNRPRVRPKGDVKLHAYLTDEAIALSDSLHTVAGYHNVFLPSPTTFLTMKLHAFRDRFQQDEQEKAGHHAMDVYRVISMMTEERYSETKAYLLSNRERSAVKSAAEIVHTYFHASDLPGITKIREHPLYRPELELDVMRASLDELFA